MNISEQLDIIVYIPKHDYKETLVKSNIYEGKVTVKICVRLLGFETHEKILTPGNAGKF